MEHHQTEKASKIAYEKAKKRVEEQKGFYYHLSVYIVINIALLFLKGDYIIFSEGIDLETRDMIKEGFEKTLSIIPILWGLTLLGYGALIFVRTFLLNTSWEKKKIQKYLNKN